MVAKWTGINSRGSLAAATQSSVQELLCNVLFPVVVLNQASLTPQ